MPFTNQRAIYDGLTGKTNTMRKARDFSPMPGNPKILSAGETWEVFTDFEFDKNTQAWYMTLLEYNRRPSLLMQYVTIELSFTNVKGKYAHNSGSQPVVFKQTIELTNVMDDQKVLVLSNPDNLQPNNVLLAGKLFNYPLGKYMRMVVKVASSAGANQFYFKGPYLTEEGWFTDD